MGLGVESWCCVLSRFLEARIDCCRDFLMPRLFLASGLAAEPKRGDFKAPFPTITNDIVPPLLDFISK